MVQYDWCHERRFNKRKRNTEVHEERMPWMMEAKTEAAAVSQWNAKECQQTT